MLLMTMLASHEQRNLLAALQNKQDFRYLHTIGYFQHLYLSLKTNSKHTNPECEFSIRLNIRYKSRFVVSELVVGSRERDIIRGKIFILDIIRELNKYC